MKYLLALSLLTFLFFSCDGSKDDLEEIVEPIVEITPAIVKEYGFTLNDFNVVRDTVRSGDTFGAILDAHGVPQSKIFEVATTYKDSFDVRRMVVGRPYVLLNSKDSLGNAQVFIYEKNRVEYSVVDLRDSISVFNDSKPVTYIEKEASGVITSSLAQTMADNNLSPYMTDRLATIYAWTVNFFKLQAGDNFKVVYTERFINDSIPAGLHEIKAAYFEHRGRPLYAFNFIPAVDTTNTVTDFYDEKAENLRRAFLKMPLKFGRLSSRYNLNRRIAYYGYKRRPHKGTDFAAPVGTPILATADGIVTESTRRGGNGKYVRIKHNGTYETQYLHMRNQNVKVGDFVRQGDVIGWIGMTGNTGGPHVCYRFWKNGKQVDPFLQDLPASKPLDKAYHEEYFQFIEPLKDQLDCISY